MVYVRLRTTVQDLDVHSSGGGPLVFGADDTVRLTIESPEVPGGESSGTRLLWAEKRLQMDDETVSRLRSHANSFVGRSSSDLTDEEIGALAEPEDWITDALIPAHEALIRAAEAVVRILRWRLAIAGPPPSAGRFDFSLDGDEWVEPWWNMTTLPWFGRKVDAPTATLGQIEKFLRDEVQPPLAWDLWHEAVRLQGSSPRAAFLLAFSAAEIGIKEFGGRRSASEKWLLDSIQSPPMTDMLSGYLPSFVDRRVNTRSENKRQAIPDWIRSVLRDGAEKRNKLVHSPKGFEPRYQPETLDVTVLIDAVHDLLYLLDWFQGPDWPREFLTDKTLDSYIDDAGPDAGLRPVA